MTRDLDNFRAHLAVELDAQVTALRSIERHVTDLRQSQDELKRMILEQGVQMREQGELLLVQGHELRELRARLNGRDQ